MLWVLLILGLGAFSASVWFTLESIREQEPRAPKAGLALAGFHLLLLILILAAPGSRPFIAGYFILALAGLGFFLIPSPGLSRSAKGALGYASGDPDLIDRFDERDIVFARNRGLPPGSNQYQEYYAAHPEKEEPDRLRREKGGPLGRPGSIDNGYRPNVAMLKASFLMADFLGPQARVDPRAALEAGTYAQADQAAPAELDPARGSKIVKGFARQLGADLVGVCRTDPRWTYSHRGEIFYDRWEDWGRELADPLPFAVVVATAMDDRQVAAAPHTPTVVESSLGYSRGAYITTILAQWFGAMGYRAVAEHNRNYDSLMVPLAVEAGLGELGRQGYLIADRFGPGVRLFVCQTDMPLATDKPLDLGAEKFCERCLKCAESCPSSSIPKEREKSVERGLLRWKLDEESCFDYWGKVGTDCCVCMAVCPFNRPDRPLHRLVRMILRRNRWAQVVFPHLDNLLYGRRWKPRRAPEWIDYPRAGQA